MMMRVMMRVMMRLMKPISLLGLVWFSGRKRQNEQRNGLVALDGNG